MAVDLSTESIPGWYRGVCVTASVRELAAEVEVEPAARAVTADIVAESWPEQDDPAFRVALFRSVEGNLTAIFDILAGVQDRDFVPETALEFAEVCAHLGITAAEVERCYRVGMASLWTRWCDIAWTHANGQAVPFDELIKGPTLTIHAYVDHVLEAVVARHEQVRHELTRTQRDRRRMLLAQILDGSIDSVPDELEEALGYTLADTHLALLVETERMSPPEAEMSLMRRAADARGAILIQHTPNAWVVLLGRSAPFEPEHLSRLRRALSELTFKVAVGDPAAGLAGLRQTRDQAFEAARVQSALGETSRCVWLRDVRLEALLLSDESRARTFLSAELGRLAGGGDAGARLRETLLTWLDTGSHVSAAAILGVHENTVRNRIRAAEELLGAPLLGRRTELQVALRLERVLNACAVAAPEEPEPRPVLAAVA
ncbi:MAG TPA: helix-turn-helix domain-containing protein [Solirubrobacteraceae bacterium]